MSKRNRANQIMRNVRLTVILLSISYATLASKNNARKSSEPLAVIEKLIKQPLQQVNSVQSIPNWTFGALKIVCPGYVKNT